MVQGVSEVAGGDGSFEGPPMGVVAAGCPILVASESVLLLLAAPASARGRRPRFRPPEGESAAALPGDPPPLVP